MATKSKFDSRQIISLDSLSQLTAGLSDVELDNILRSADSDLTSLLRLTVTDSFKIHVEPNIKINPETGKQTILHPVDNTIPDFSGSDIVVPSSAGGFFTIDSVNDIELNISTSSYIKLGIHLNSQGNIKLNLGAESPSADTAEVPKSLTSSVAIGYAVLYCDSFGNIEPIDKTNIFQYASLNESTSTQSFQDRNAKLIGGGSWSFDLEYSSQEIEITNVADVSANISTPSELSGQIFQTSIDLNIGSIAVDISNNGSSDTNNVFIDVWSLDISDVPDALIATSQPIKKNDLPKSFNLPFAKFVFTQPVSLSSQNKYAFVIRVEGALTDSLLVPVASSGSYEHDQIYSVDGGSTWIQNANANIANFIIYPELIETLSWSDSAFIQVPNMQNSFNKIDSQSIQIRDNEIAYVNINRLDRSATSLTVDVKNIDDLPQSNDLFIFARRDGQDIIIGNSSFRLKTGEILELDGALSEINRRLNQFKMSISNDSPDQLNISGADIEQLDGTVLGHMLSSNVLSFSGANVNFSTGGVSGNAQGTSFVPADIPLNHYFWYGVGIESGSLLPNNTVSAKIKISPASNSAISKEEAELPVIEGDIKLGAILVFNSGSGIQIELIKTLSAGLSSSETDGSDELAPNVEVSPGFNMAYGDDLSESPLSSDSLIEISTTNASYSSSKTLFKLDADYSLTFTGSTTNIILSAEPNFTIKSGDIIYIDELDEWRKIETVNSQTSVTLDAGFSAAISSSSGLISQAVWTKDIINSVGSESEKTRPRDFYPNTDIHEISLSYLDSLILSDSVADYTEDARVVASASQYGLQDDLNSPTSDKFSAYFKRPNAPADIPNYALSDHLDKQRLFLVFFCNPQNNDVSLNGSANLLNYSVSFYEELGLTNGGTLQSSFTMSDASGVQINCRPPFVDNGFTYLTLDWHYVPNVNDGQTKGDLAVIVDGRELPRYAPGSTLGDYYVESPTNNRQIRFNKNLSLTPVSIEVYRRQGTLDTSDYNAQRISLLQESSIVTDSVTLESIPYQKIVTNTLGGAFTVSLPALPETGDTVRIQDSGGVWNTNSVTVDPGVNPIQGVSGTDLLDVNWAWIEYEYYDETTGWIVRF